MPILYCFDNYSFVIQFEIRECDVALFFFLKIALAICGLLWFHTYCWIVVVVFFFSISVGNAIGIFIGITFSYRTLEVSWTF